MLTIMGGLDIDDDGEIKSEKTLGIGKKLATSEMRHVFNRIRVAKGRTDWTTSKIRLGSYMDTVVVPFELTNGPSELNQRGIISPPKRLCVLVHG